MQVVTTTERIIGWLQKNCIDGVVSRAELSRRVGIPMGTLSGADYTAALDSYIIKVGTKYYYGSPRGIRRYRQKMGF